MIQLRFGFCNSEWMVVIYPTMIAFLGVVGDSTAFWVLQLDSNAPIERGCENLMVLPS